MSYLSEHLPEHEVACKGESCCDHTAALSRRLAAGFEYLRAAVNFWREQRGFDPVGITPNSGFRCYSHNRNEGGSKDSQHTKGRALDLPTPPDMNVRDFYVRAKDAPGFTGIIIYDWGLHVDVRDGEPYFDDRRT